MKLKFAFLLSFSSSMSLAAPAVSFNEVFQKILQPKCIECHDSTSGLPDYTSHASTLESGVINLSNPIQSPILLAVKSGDMPAGGDKLSVDSIQLLEDWITQGALNDPPAQSAQLIGVTPAKGESAGGYLLTLNGVKLKKPMKILIGSQECLNPAQSSEEALTCVAPKLSVGKKNISVLFVDNTKLELEQAFEVLIPLQGTFESLQQRIFKPKCITCHSDEKPTKGVSFSSYQSLMSAKKAIVPFNLKKSEVYEETSEGEMPRNGTPLTKQELKALADWILSGAKL
jgi:mono/diheme cytochrome c family protein